MIEFNITKSVSIKEGKTEFHEHKQQTSNAAAVSWHQKKCPGKIVWRIVQISDQQIVYFKLSEKKPIETKTNWNSEKKEENYVEQDKEKRLVACWRHSTCLYSFFLPNRSNGTEWKKYIKVEAMANLRGKKNSTHAKGNWCNTMRCIAFCIRSKYRKMLKQCKLSMLNAYMYLRSNDVNREKGKQIEKWNDVLAAHIQTLILIAQIAIDT